MVRTALGIAFAAIVAQPAVAGDIALLPGETLLEVKATGQASYLPDAAFVTVGVVSTGASAREATDGNARSMAAVIAAIRKAGVEARYIRTQQINVDPRFARGGTGDYDGQARITGYVARNSVVVTVTKLDIAPQVIAAAFDAGANSVSGPNLGSMDPQKGGNDARRDALANARAEADAYAAGLGMRVARVLRVSQRGDDSRVSYDIVVTGSRAGGGPPPPPPPAPPTPVASGEMRRTVSLSIDYALVPAIR